MLEVEKLLQTYGDTLLLEIASNISLKGKIIKTTGLERPGLCLTGYLKGYAPEHILIFGKREISYLLDMHLLLARERLVKTLGPNVPCVLIANNAEVPPILKEVAARFNAPILVSKLSSFDLMQKLSTILLDELAPCVSLHGTLVEAFGIGLLIQGDSSVGKSEAALGLIEKGHRLVSDDIVLVQKKHGRLTGSSAELTKHLLEVRGIGLLNIAQMFGAICVRNKKRIDLIVKLELWDDTQFYDRIGIQEEYQTVLETDVPYYILPVKPGRDIVMLLETIVLNHRLRKMGYNSAKDFTQKLRDTIHAKHVRKEGLEI